MTPGLSRRLLFTLFAVLLLGACDKPTASSPAEAPPGPTPAKAASSVRIVSWNLQWFPGHKPSATDAMAAAHMEAARKAVAELKPDVLLLQEVRNWDAAAKLCEALPGLTTHVASAFDAGVPDARPQNQVVAAKLPADSAWSAKWVGGIHGPPRGYAFAALELPGRKFLLCWSLHLKSNLGDFAENVSMRTESARQLLAHVREMVALYSQRGPCAVVIGGDMNTSVDDPQFTDEPTMRGLFAAGLWWTHEGVPFAKRTTIPAEGGYADNCFDHVLTAGLGKPVAFVKAFPGLSDHYPVIVDVDFSKADFSAAVDVDAGLKVLASVPAPNIPKNMPGVIAANDAVAISAAVGNVATVRGKVSGVGATKTASITFINFAGNKRDQFVVIVKKDNLASVAEPFGGKLDSLTGKTIEVRGEIFLYKETPEIEIRSAADLRVVE